MMSNFHQGQTYRELLLLRQGRNFSEYEIIETLRQVLFQLAQIHNQNRVHGAISLDTLFNDFNIKKAVLIDNTALITSNDLGLEIQSASSAEDDIWALGILAIILLTGKESTELTSDRDIWNWQEYCLVSDQLAAILDKAVAPKPENRYANAMEMLRALNSLVPPTPNSIDTTGLDRGDGDRSIPDSYPRLNRSISSWQWSAIGAGATAIAILSGFGLVKLLNPQSNSQPNSSIAPQNSDRILPPAKNNLPVSPEASPSNTLASTPKYLFLSARQVTDADLSGKTALELDIMRNEIYARYGRRFDRQDLQNYFNNQPWYRPAYSPQNFPDNLLSSLEQENAAYILTYQKRNSLFSTNEFAPSSQPSIVSSNSNQISSFYFIADDAFPSLAEAEPKIRSLKASGYNQAGSFWIPDYPNLSGKPFFNVYPATFNSRQSCAEFLRNYSQRHPDAYCAFASKDKNASADRFYAK